MKLRALTGIVALIATATVAPPGGAAVPTVKDPTGLLASENIELLTSLPLPGVIGARFRDNVMYVTSVSGLTTFDISDPKAPALLGELPLPHFENEDVDLGGNILLISNDAAESTGILYVVDISDPAAPALLSTTQMGGNPALGGPGHTVSCILDCKFAWVTDSGGFRVFDLSDPAVPVDMGTFESPAYGGAATHDVQVDPQGYVWVVGFGGTFAYKLPADYDGNGLGELVAQTSEEGFSTYFEEFGVGDGGNPNDYIHHNSYRGNKSDTVYVTEEDYTRPACQGAGSFQSWKLPIDKKGRPTGKDMTPLDQWEVELLRDTSPTAAVCSAHYFDVERNIVAQGWYEMGTRFLDISNPKKIRQIGYYIPRSAMTWAAHFAPTDPSLSTIYALDASHGIDVLSIVRPPRGSLSAPRQKCRSAADCDRMRPASLRAPVRRAWRNGAPAGVPIGDFGYGCRFGFSPS